MPFSYLVVLFNKIVNHVFYGLQNISFDSAYSIGKILLIYDTIM